MQTSHSNPSSPINTITLLLRADFQIFSPTHLNKSSTIALSSSSNSPHKIKSSAYKTPGNLYSLPSSWNLAPLPPIPIFTSFITASIYTLNSQGDMIHLSHTTVDPKYYPWNYLFLSLFTLIHFFCIPLCLPFSNDLLYWLWLSPWSESIPHLHYLLKSFCIYQLSSYSIFIILLDSPILITDFSPLFVLLCMYPTPSLANFLKVSLPITILSVYLHLTILL